MAIWLKCCQNRGMKLTQIRHMLAVAERASLQSGAEALGVSQSALVRSIRGLEQELGAALFKRHDRSMTLTPVGEIFVRRAAAAQLELDRASDELRLNLGLTTGRVSIGLCADAHVQVLPKVLDAFQRRFRDVRVQIVEAAFAKVEPELRDGVLDIYVGQIWPSDRTAGLKIDRLYDVAPIIVGRKGHPLASATSLAQLADARWIATSRRELESLFEQHHLPRPDIVVEAETGLSLLSAAAASDALAIAPASWSSLIAQTDVLTSVPVQETLEPYPVHVAIRAQPPLTPAAAHLHALIVQTRDRRYDQG